MVENADIDPFLEKQRKEKVLIVDEDNNPVGTASRQEMRQRKLWHRVSYTFIVTDEEHGSKLLVQKRSMKKDYCPGFLSLSTGGVVGEGEDDDLSAVRELEEEIGIKNEGLEKIKVVKCVDGERSKSYANVYVLRNFNPDANPLTLQADEVDEVRYLSRTDIENLIAAGTTEQITPNSYTIYQDCFKRASFEESLNL